MKFYEVTYQGRYWYFLHLKDVLEYTGEIIEKDPHIYESGLKFRIVDWRP